MLHQSRGKDSKSYLSSIFNCMGVITGSDGRVSSWAAAVVVDSFYATCPWEIISTRDFNQPLSQCGMCIPIALCSIAIVVVV